MPSVRILQSVAGLDFSWVPGDVVEMTDESAAAWADGHRGEYVSVPETADEAEPAETPEDVEEAPEVPGAAEEPEQAVEEVPETPEAPRRRGPGRPPRS